MRQMNVILSSLLICFFLFVDMTLSAQTIDPQNKIVRTAIEFGSGSIKILSCIIDVKTQQIMGEPLLSTIVNLKLTEDVAAHDGKISEEMQLQALAIIADLKEQTLTAAANAGDCNVHFVGVATAVFRTAKNGADLLQNIEQQLGIHFQILPQEEESKLGYLSAKALYPETKEQDLIAWDSGNSSFQLTGKNNDQYNLYQAPFGHGSIRILLSKEMRKGPPLGGNESGNPVTAAEAEELMQKIYQLMPAKPDWLQHKLTSEKTQVATWGDGEAVFMLVAQALKAAEGGNEPLQQAKISLADVQWIINTYVGQNDQFFEAAGVHRKTLTAAILILSVMNHLGIEEICLKRASGNTPGMLISPMLWKTETSATPVIP